MMRLSKIRPEDVRGHMEGKWNELISGLSYRQQVKQTNR